MTINKVISYLDGLYPSKMAEEWDNIGILLGKRDMVLNGVLLALDVTDKVIDKAIENNCNLIITHHPLIFKPLKNITSDTLIGKKIIKLIENKIAVYTMHTNLDSAPNGLNDFLGEFLFEEKISKILDKNIYNDIEYGIGRVYNLKEKLSIKKLSSLLKEKLCLDSINIVTENNDIEVKKIALVSGSGATYWRKAKKSGADILITGEIGRASCRERVCQYV